MDPVSAVGLAAATAQFIGIGIKATALCLQIRDNVGSATKFNEELEELTREVKQSRQALRAGVSNQAPRRITELAIKCEKSTDELLKLLEHVRGAGENISTARKVFRAMKERKTVEKLQNSLQEKERLLGSLLVQDIWRRFDLQHVEQSKHFAALGSQVQKIIRELAQQQLGANFNTKRLTRDISSLGAHIDTGLESSDLKAQTLFEQTQRSVERLSKEATGSIQQLSETLQQKRHYDDFLRSLFFSEKDERRANINDAASGTLEWMFASRESQESLSNSRDNISANVEWDNFGAWLRYHSSVYWICGKLGSGKSTLMAHIVDDYRVRTGLEEWSQGHRLHILSFFFWRPGTQLQKSITGLLRSLLYEVCQAEPEIVTQLLRRLSIETERIPTWTEKSLTTAIVNAIGLACDAQFCVFIDGLDEFLGDYDELINLIFKLQNLENIKFCVSSRPEVQLASRLAECEQLCLQDLNYPDISKYVKQKLSDTTVNNGFRHGYDIQREIISRAEGVFLWAVLVTQAVVRGAISADDESTLLQRIKQTPMAIDELFEMMIRKVNVLHRASLSFYLGVANLPNTVPYKAYSHYKFKDAIRYMTSISIIAASRMTTPISFDDNFWETCKKTEVQIIAQSAGLLEIRSDGLCDEANWKLGSNWFISSTPRLGSSISQHLPPFLRVPCKDPPSYPKALRYECRYLSWVHRSAYDFFYDSQTIQKYGLSQLSSTDVLEKLIEGGLKYLSIAPSCGPVGDYLRTLTSMRLKAQLLALQALWEMDSSAALVATDRLHGLVRQIDPIELAYYTLDPIGVVYYSWQRAVITADYKFWKLCADLRYSEYIQRRLHLIPPEAYTTILARSFKFFPPAYGVALKLLRLIKKSAGWERITCTFNGYTTLLCHEPGLFPRRVSYNSLQQRNTSTSLMVSMAAFASAVREFSASRQHTHSPTCTKKLPNLLYEISNTVNLYIEIVSTRRLSLQLSASLFHKYTWPRARCLRAREGTKDTSGLRIVCLPWLYPESQYWIRPKNNGRDIQQNIVEVCQSITLVPSAKTTATILRRLSLDLGSYGVYSDWVPRLYIKSNERERCHDMIYDDFLANKQRMSATEQLFTLACIRLHLRDLLRKMWCDPDEPIRSCSPESDGFFEDDRESRTSETTTDCKITRRDDDSSAEEPDHSEWVTDQDEDTDSD
ncbi:hypothetical protein HD806DRAFT_457084 [Xylariaceae sp. AK1471]|nr:hypothetical protein HD806DRAFT_457084 [Xylariaceae sp. AK1471]